MWANKEQGNDLKDSNSDQKYLFRFTFEDLGYNIPLYQP